MEQFLPLIIQLASGAAGGNAAGAALKSQSLGTVGNSIAGIVGGGIGGQLISILGMAAATGGAMDAGNIASSVAGGGAGGAIILIIINLIRKFIGK